jgi:hypothetical protein
MTLKGTMAIELNLAAEIKFEISLNRLNLGGPPIFATQSINRNKENIGIKL